MRKIGDILLPLHFLFYVSGVIADLKLDCVCDSVRYSNGTYSEMANPLAKGARKCFLRVVSLALHPMGLGFRGRNAQLLKTIKLRIKVLPGLRVV